MGVKSALVKTAAKAKIGLVKHAPQIAVVAGVGMLVGAVVASGKETIVAKEVFDEAKDLIGQCEDSFTEGKVYIDKASGETVPYTFETYQHDIRTIVLQTTAKLLKTYRWTILLTVGGVTSIGWAFHTLNKALIGANLALQTLNAKYDRLYQFAVKEHGEAKIKDIVDGVTIAKSEKHKDPETGKMITENTYTVPDNIPSNWIIWGPGDSGWEDNDSYKEAYLRKVQNHLTDSLTVWDIMWLSEVIEMFGKHHLEDQEEEFRVTGWIGSNSKYFDPDVMDGYVKIEHRVLEDGRWLLTFNTDGVILPYLPKRKKKLDWNLAARDLIEIDAAKETLCGMVKEA